MIIQGRIVDSKTGSPLQSANISIIDSSGKDLSINTQSGVSGTFYLNNAGIDGNHVLVSFVGYQSLIYDPKDLVSVISSVIPMQVQADVLPGVDVTPEQAGSGAILFLLLIVFGLVMLSSKRKKRSMGDIDLSHYVIPIGIVIGGYFLVKGVLGKLGLGNDKIDENKDVSDQTAADQQKAQGDAAGVNNMANRNMSDNSLTSIATQLTDSTHTFTYDYEEMVKMLAYFSGFRSADAQKFLSIYVQVNGVTLYQWWRSKLNDAALFDAWSIPQYSQAYTANFKTMGVDMDNVWSMLQSDFVRTCVAYIYKIAGVAMT